MSILREIFYGERGNQLVRIAISPIKSLIPKRFHFPVSGNIKVRLSGLDPLHLNVNPTCYLGKVLYWNGIAGFESGVHQVFKYLIGRADTFVDVGANIGFYSLMAAKYNPEVKVVCFEPLPASFKYLKANILANGATNIDAHQIALSDKSGTTTFYYSINPKFPFVKDQLTSTGSLDKQQADRTSLLESADVEQMTLDQFVNTFKSGQIDLIKLDTEATEHFVLDGAKETIGRFRPIILCEVLPGKVETEIQSRIESLKYVPFKITDNGLTEVHDLSHDDAGTNDHLFCPQEKLNDIKGLLNDDQRDTTTGWFERS